jgi:hypothetical protein
VEGLAATLVGLWTLSYLVDRPEQATWLSLEQRQALQTAIASEELDKTLSGVVTFAAVFRTPRLLLFTAIYALIQISGYGVAFYLPSQVSTLVGIQIGPVVGLLSAIPWAAAMAAGSFWPSLAMRTGYRRTFAAISLMSITLGLSLSAHLPPALAISALCLATAGIITAQPIFWTFPASYFGGIGAAAGIASINAVGNLGGFVAPNIKTWLEHRYAMPQAGLYFLAGSALLAALLVTQLEVGLTSPPGRPGLRRPRQ